ncbi:MAG: hypothetical protein HYX81_00390 [Chloroflexi bacterium]|nr:hypothetical protein [Chloroflexota bacterium]
MPEELRVIVLLLHLIAMVFMAAPLYALIAVNERARFPVPPGYNTDRYLENLIKYQAMRCYAFMAVILVTGILLVWARASAIAGWAWWGDLALIAKLVAFAILVTLLSQIHFGIQPKIEAIVNKYKAGEEISGDDRTNLVALRVRRKRRAPYCLFLVLTSLVMGVRVMTQTTPWWLVAVFLVASAIFAWRAYKTPVRMGWL